jgi:nitrite reductase/ring-hydroxylating ferredoxin subunit
VSSVEEIKPGMGAVIRRGSSKFAVSRDDKGSLRVRSSVCSHLGCTVSWNSTEHTWDCPCHGSRFTPDGKLLNGPARYWGFVGGRYRYNYGFWGRHIGYYGGINYGFGYVGIGYQGGYWNGDRFNYNCAVNNVNITNVQVYNRTVTNTVVVNNTPVNITNNRSSYNGPGGVTRRPLPTEVAAHA